ncbi:MAG: HNH endonuclease signature motif containing protein [Devosia marina]|uniref:HNH endonuclease signature motif containing protein n=1 Tax=Devosia marina TaxID=2683198 RepID=UPI0032EB9969
MRGQRIIYNAAEMAWLEANRMMVISDYHRAFVDTFGRSEVSALNLHGLRKRKGWKTGREGDRYKGRHRKFSAEELAWLEANRTLPISEYFAAFVAAFPREDVRPQNLHALRKRMGWKTGRTGQFPKGNVSHNKGKRCPEGTGGRHPNARRTQFKKGQLPHNTQGAGHERIDSKDGYVVMIVDEVNPWTGAKTRPVHKHVHLWEQKHGPVPEGHCLKCLDGNKRNTDPSNWELIPRGVLPRLNGGRATRIMPYDQAPVELKPSILAVAKIDHAIHEKRKARA